MAMSLPTPRSSTRERRKNLVCDICRQIFRSPRALPNCHHCFCLQCLDIVVTSKGATFPCPTCGETANVPAGGVQHFKENPYILEEELEEERNAVAKSYCSKHNTEELKFFCKECDLSICSHCLMTKHNHGPQCAEDLSTTAERCKTNLAPLKKQLKRDIKNATERSAVAQNNIRAVTEKATELKQQLKERKDRIVSWAEKHHETAVRQLDHMTQVMTQELTKDGHDVQHYVDRLIQIEQRIHNAMGSNNDADVVAVEKETRRDREAIKQLIQMQNHLSLDTQLPDLNCNNNCLTEKSIKDFIGSPFKKQLPLTPVHFEDDTGDVITPFYRCPATAEGQEVHAISQQVQLGQQNVYISYGGLAPTYKDETLIEIKNNSTESVHNQRIGKKITFDENGSVMINHPNEKHLIGNSKRSVRVSYKTTDGNVTVYSTGIRTLHEVEIKQTRTVLNYVDKVMTPISFDANNFTSIFIVLSENASPPAQEHDRSSRNIPHAAGNGSQASRTGSANMRKIQMYLLDQSDPVCSYVPPQQPFFPTAVCFCIINGQEVLLIADMATDSIHVVDVANKNFRFIRYLAQWSPHLVRPTALYRIQQEHEVWIGCKNGWVLKCKPGNYVRQQQRDDEGDEEEAADGGSDDNLNIDNASVTSTRATSAELLRVGNGSMTSLATTNRMSDVSESML